MSETQGDHSNTKCPCCGKTNHYITDGVKVEFGKTKCFSKPCLHCQKTIYYRANFEVKIVASSEPLANP